MKLAIAELRSSSAYSQSKHYTIPKERSETHDAYEKRTWRNRMHVDESGAVYIPPMAFKNCLSDAAKYLSKQIPGKGKSTYTKHFEAGILVMDPLVLPIQAEEVKGEEVFVPADGKRGGGNRVLKTFPVLPDWQGQVKFYVLDEIVSQDVFHEHLRWAGQIIGVGRFRPRNNGYYGRFKVANVDWQDVDI